MPKVSFIIPSYNSSRTVLQTIDSIQTQTNFSQVLEIIIVDSSNDNTRSLIGQLSSQELRVVELPEKVMPATARNRGAQVASGDLFCFIDSDVKLEKNWLTEVIKKVADGGQIGGGSVSVPDFQEGKSLALAQLYLQFNESLAVGNQRTVALLPACNMFITRELFNKIRGFPEIRASEDVLLCLNASRFSNPWFLPQAKCFHIFRESPKAYMQNQRTLGKYILIYRRKVYPRWFYQGLWPLVLLPAFALIKFSRIKWRVFRAGWPHFSKYLISSPWFAVGAIFWIIGFAEACFKKEQP